MSFFDVTDEEIKDAIEGKSARFEDNEEVVFLVKETKEKTFDSGDKALLIECSVVGGNNDGKEYTHWLRKNEMGLKQYVKMMSCYFDRADIKGKSAGAMVGRKFKSVAKLKPAKDSDKVYTNFWDWAPGDGGPDLTSDDVPF